MIKWIEKSKDLDRDMLTKFENFVNSLESTWNLLTVKVLNIDNRDCPKIAISNVGYVDIQPTSHGSDNPGIAIVLAKRNLLNKTAINEMAFCKIDPTSKDIMVKKYNNLYTRGINIIYRTINNAIMDAYQYSTD